MLHLPGEQDREAKRRPKGKGELSIQREENKRWEGERVKTDGGRRGRPRRRRVWQERRRIRKLGGELDKPRVGVG